MHPNRGRGHTFWESSGFRSDLLVIAYPRKRSYKREIELFRVYEETSAQSSSTETPNHLLHIPSQLDGLTQHAFHQFHIIAFSELC